MGTGVFPDNSAAIARLITAVVHQRSNTIALRARRVATPRPPLPDDPWAEEGFNFLERQTSGIGGGTTEMARNNISERVLGMPREHDRRQEHPVPRRAEGPARRTELPDGPSDSDRRPYGAGAAVVVTDERVAGRVGREGLRRADELADDGLALVPHDELPVLHGHM